MKNLCVNNMTATLYLMRCHIVSISAALWPECACPHSSNTARGSKEDPVNVENIEGKKNHTQQLLG